jgi:hypothetical protein
MATSQRVSGFHMATNHMMAIDHRVRRVYDGRQPQGGRFVIATNSRVSRVHNGNGIYDGH